MPKIRCSKCGERNDVDNEECFYCGNNLVNSVPTLVNRAQEKEAKAIKSEPPALLNTEGTMTPKANSIKNNWVVYILLTIIIILLSAVILKDPINNYFINKKNESRKQEILAKGNVFGVSGVAVKCYKDIIYDKDSASCNDAVSSFDNNVARWRSLIQNKININCSDFTDKNDAQNFFEYLSSEYARGYYDFKRIEDDGQETMVFQGTKSSDGSVGFDGHCYYDPYGLDTNHDCNACENLK